eukprot:COSAG01_NODE_7731_length_3080_cov_167.349547_5_plen_99_part_00
MSNSRLVCARNALWPGSCRIDGTVSVQLCVRLAAWRHAVQPALQRYLQALRSHLARVQQQVRRTTACPAMRAVQWATSPRTAGVCADDINVIRTESDQ